MAAVRAMEADKSVEGRRQKPGTITFEA